MSHRKPSIKTRCVANCYAGEDQTIAEFSTPAGGGLISVRYLPAENRVVVDVYRVDATVTVRTPEAGQ
jgi:hypothetical protein